MDGSGDHSNYHQLSKVHFTTKQVMSVCFSVHDEKGASANWSSAQGGSNKPQNTRPLALFPAKETKELLQEFIPIVEAEISEIKREGLCVNFGEEESKARCDRVDMGMADGKMVACLLQLGGAYCTMCT